MPTGKACRAKRPPVAPTCTRAPCRSNLLRAEERDEQRADLATHIDVTGVVETPWGVDGLYGHDPSGSLVKFGQVTERFTSAEIVQEAPSD